MHISRPITGLVLVSLIVVGTAPPVHAEFSAPVIEPNVSIAPGKITISISSAPSMPADVTSSTFQFHDGGFFWYDVIGSPPVNSPSVEISATIFTDLAFTYPVKLRAVGTMADGVSQARGPGSNSISVRLQATPPTAVEVAPKTGDPTGLTVTFVAPTSLVASGVIGYEYSVNGGTTWANAGVDGSATTFDITGLGDPGTSSVLVRAMNAGYKGEASSPNVSVRHGVPEAPSNLRADSEIVGGSLDISWDRPPSYALSAVTAFEYSIDGGAWQGVIASAASSATIPGLVDGRQTSVRVRARNASGAGPASSAIELNLPAPVVEPPAAAPPVTGPPAASPPASSPPGGSTPAPSSAPLQVNPSTDTPAPASTQEVEVDVEGEVRALVPEVMRSMSPAALAQLPASAFAVMSRVQLRALAPEQVTALKAEQLAAIDPISLRAMRPETLSRLTMGQLRAFTIEQMRTLRVRQVKALGPAKRRLVTSALVA